MPSFDITEKIRGALGIDVAATADASVALPPSARWDCSIGGIPLLFAAGNQQPVIQRETATFRRDRVDTERNPGEQSLDSGSWLRSQASWHYGSGLSSAEPLEVSDAEAQFRYKRGGGVDPWTPGQLSLLHATASVLSSAGSSQHLIGVDTGVLHADGTTVKHVATDGTVTTVTWGGSGTGVTSLTSDGASYYAANNTGIYKGALPTSAGSKIWDTGATTIARFVKSRLMAAVGVSLYELATGGPTLPTALYTHPNTSWTWTDFAEGPAAIYVSGYSGDTSYIYRIDVDTTSTTVTLNQPTVVAEMPRGEQVHSLYVYVGSYMVVGTSAGARVAAIESDGSLSLGPLVVESADGCKDAVAQGSFVWVTAGAKGSVGDRTERAGLWRIDLGTNLNGNPLQFAVAADLVAPSGTSGQATQVTTAGGFLWFAVQGSGVFREQATYVTEGWLETGRIRLGTLESKAWQDIRLLASTTASGGIAAYAQASEATAPSAWSRVLSIASGVVDDTGSLVPAAAAPLGSLYAAVRLSTTDTATTPVLIGYQLRAIPAPQRTELVQVRVECFDRLTDRQGAQVGYRGLAWDLFSALKSMESTQSVVTWMDHTTGERATAYVEQVGWVRTAPPTRNLRNVGGPVTVTLRLV